MLYATAAASAAVALYDDDDDDDDPTIREGNNNWANNKNSECVWAAVVAAGAHSLVYNSSTASPFAAFSLRCCYHQNKDRKQKKKPTAVVS